MIRKIDGGIVFTVKIVPGSSKTAICGLLDEMIKIKLTAPPQKGKANQLLLQFLAKQLKVKKNSINITSGHSGPIKNIQVMDISAEKLLEDLDLHEKGLRQ